MYNRENEMCNLGIVFAVFRNVTTVTIRNRRLDMAEKKKSQGIILAISCTNKVHASKQDDFCMCNGLANYVAKVGGYTCR